MKDENLKVIELRDQDMEGAIKGHAKLVVDCWAPWCGDCRRMASVFSELAADNYGNIIFASINLDTNPDTKAAYQIMAIPTLLIFKDGKLVASMVEPSPRKSFLQARIEESLA
jgi:thioredoxin 1